MNKLLAFSCLLLWFLIVLNTYILDKKIEEVELKFTKEITALKKQLELYKAINHNKLINPELLKAIIFVESSNNPKAYNKHSGAIGLMQLTPIVYNDICSLTKREAFNPIKNVACGSMYFKHLLNRFNGNIEKSLSYYNNGYRGNRRYVMKVKRKLAKGVN